MTPKHRLMHTLVAALIGSTLPAAFAQDTSSSTPPPSDASDTSGTSDASSTKSRGSKGSTSSEAASTSGGTRSQGTAAAGANQDAVQNLLAAAQALRESVQQLAQLPPGQQRNDAIRQGNQALIDVQNAIVALPPGMLTATAGESSYKKSLVEMQKASDKLQAAAAALAEQPPSKQRDQALQRVNTALLETSEAMLASVQLAAGGANMSGASGSAGSESTSGTSGTSGAAGTSEESGKERATGTTGSSESGAGASGSSQSGQSSGQSSSQRGDMGGSAEVTGRPGGNTVELGNQPGSDQSQDSSR